MPVYTYTARNSKGKKITGRVSAASLEKAGDQIEQGGVLPIYLKEEVKTTSVFFGGLFSKGVSSEDMVMFTFQLTTLIGSGIPILQGLKTIASQTENKILKRTLEQAGREVEGGSTLSESLARSPKIFLPIYTNMIRAGEASGRLEEMFERLGEMIEHEAETRDKLQTALRYPKMVVGTLLLAFFIIVTFIMPRFVEIFGRFEIALPLPTRIMIALNTMVNDYWFVLLGVAAVLFAGWRMFVASAPGRLIWHRVQITVPIMGPFLLKGSLSRFAHMLGTLNRSGLPIIENLTLTAAAIGNDVVAAAINRVRDSVQKGQGLAEPMQDNPLFTPLVVQMVSVGETTGDLDNVLLKVSNYYDREVDYGTKKMASY
ncbi:MAG: type II secretion system F family protein, partial [Deltaproteobacteria bacterium]|nr:type II secretion system F family protein [Deltaproteobacteria bacterium]